MNSGIEITLPSKEEIWDETSIGNTVFDIFKQHSPKCTCTDLAIATGAWYSLANKTCYYWTKSYYRNSFFYACTNGGKLNYAFFSDRDISIKPSLVINDQENFDGITANKRINEDGVYEIEFGEYPQYAASLEMQRALDFVKNRLEKTGKEYTFALDSESKHFEPERYIEYEYEGKKYIHMRLFKDRNNSLSNGEVYSKGEFVWIEVSPVTWLVNEKTNTLVSKNGLLGGMPIQFKEFKDEVDFNKSHIKDYLDKYMLHDLTYTADLTKQNDAITKRDKKNPYGFDFEELKEEDIIIGAIESDVPVFLHGQSSDGKSARVKQLDSDCVILYMRNATPESLVGKSVYDPNSKELIDIKPSWLVKLEKKCEDEPDKNHIVFFDEISNALPSVQGMAFNIILDREVNGKWNLPENARIVAAGNELKDSLAANRIAEPLFNRFAHVYIKTEFQDWLIWASENNIHPAICAYIAYTNGDALRTEYNGETPNADPRKWEMASKMLYKSNNPEMIRSLVGEEVTADFVKFCKQRVITLDDVLNDNYTDEELRSLDTAEKYATAMALSGVDEDNFEKVRGVVKKLGKEIVATFDMMWAKNEEDRINRVEECQKEEQEKEQKTGSTNNKLDPKIKKCIIDSLFLAEKLHQKHDYHGVKDYVEAAIFIEKKYNVDINGKIIDEELHKVVEGASRFFGVNSEPDQDEIILGRDKHRLAGYDDMINNLIKKIDKIDKDIFYK